jgi:hypothetical protein
MRLKPIPFVVMIGAALSLTLPMAVGAADSGGENRCGWFINPTPGNAWLDDRDGEWTISIQGGDEADGDWPDFKARQWVHTNAGSYGHGCACMHVTIDRPNMRILKIISSQAKPLATCRQDPMLREPK